MKENEYKCERCELTFTKGWSDEEAQVESEKLWGDDPNMERAIICQDCFDELMAWVNDHA